MVISSDLFKTDYGIQINVDDWNKTIVFERSGLIFIFNFHISHSIPGYDFIVQEPGDYQILLNTDSTEFGGHGRIDENTVFTSQYNEEDKFHRLFIYNTNRTAMVLKKI